jgi:hypothetical protein
MTIIGVERRGMPSQNFGSVNYCAVLVQGEANDVTCYIGEGNPHWVALEGAKVTLAEAVIYFPALVSEMEQRGLTYRGPRGG